MVNHRSSQKHSQTPLYGHPLNMDTSLLRTVCFVPGERRSLHFLNYGQPVNKDIFYDPSVSILTEFKFILVLLFNLTVLVMRNLL